MGGGETMGPRPSELASAKGDADGAAKWPSKSDARLARRRGSLLGRNLKGVW